MPYKARLVQERYVRKRIMDWLKANRPLDFVRLSCSTVAFRRIAKSAVQRRAFPKPYYKESWQRELCLREHYFEQELVDEYLDTVILPEMAAGQNKALEAWITNPRMEQRRI